MKQILFILTMFTAMHFAKAQSIALPDFYHETQYGSNWNFEWDTVMFNRWQIGSLIAADSLGRLGFNIEPSSILHINGLTGTYDYIRVIDNVSASGLNRFRLTTNALTLGDAAYPLNQTNYGSFTANLLSGTGSMQKDEDATSIAFTVQNTNTGASAGVMSSITTAGSGDPSLTIGMAGAANEYWNIGVDNSASNALRFSYGATSALSVNPSSAFNKFGLDVSGYIDMYAGLTGGSITTGHVLKWDGSKFTPQAESGGGGGGTVTSVGLTVPSLLSVSGSPITTSGTFAITWNGTDTRIPYFGASGLTTSLNFVYDYSGDGRIELTGGNYLYVTNPFELQQTKILPGEGNFYNASTSARSIITGANLEFETTSGGELNITKEDGTTDYTITLPNEAPADGEFLQFVSGTDWDWAVPSGTVASFSSGNLSPLFTTSVTNPTTTPALSFTLSNAGANTWFGNNTGSSAAPAYNSAGTVTKADDTNVTLTLGGTPTNSVLNSFSITAGWTGTLSTSRGGWGGAASVTSPLSLSSGTLSLPITDNQVVVGTGTSVEGDAGLTYDGGTNALTLGGNFIMDAKISEYNNAAPADGQLLIGNTAGGTFDAATLAEGSAIDITNGAGSITILHDLNELTTDNSYDYDDDYIEYYDAGEAANNKIVAGTLTRYALLVQADVSNPADAATTYLGNMPRVPISTDGISRIYMSDAGTITAADIFVYAGGTSGSNEAWSFYVRVNSTTDHLIETVSASTAARRFDNTSLAISLSAGDYFEIKMVNPTWATNPTNVVIGGNILVK